MKDGLGNIMREADYYEDNSLKLVREQKPIAGGLITAQQYNYTLRGELFEQIDALGKKYTNTYDENGNLKSVKDPLGKTVNFTYDSADRLTVERLSPSNLNIRIEYGYDKNSNRTSMIMFNPATGINNATYTFKYDRADRLEKVIYPDPGHTALWTYNEHGEVKTYTDPNGKVQTNTYDAMGRLISENHGAPYNVNVTRQYEGIFNVKQISDGVTTVDYAHDTLDRLTSMSLAVSGTPFNKTMTYEYFASDRRKKMTDPEGIAYNYTYDGVGRLSTLGRDNQTYATFDYDQGWREKKVTYKNGSFTEYQYTDRGEVKRVRTKKSTNQTLASFFYQYNARGDRTSLTREHLGEVINYGYDDIRRLISEVSTGSTSGPVTVPPRDLSWLYDKAGNHTQQTENGQLTTYEYDAENRLIEVNGPAGLESWSYDNNGNMTGRSLPNNVVETFGYDHLNRFNFYGRNENLVDTALFFYGRPPEGGARLNKFDFLTSMGEWRLIDGDNVVKDYLQMHNGPLMLQNSYVQPLSLSATIARIDASNNEHYYVRDALNSTAHMIDATQTIVKSEMTDAWGNVVASNATVSDRHSFTGGERDIESGMLHLNYRSYESRVGRFSSWDPMLTHNITEGFSYYSTKLMNPKVVCTTCGGCGTCGSSCSGASLDNAYTYGQDNPVSMVDPLGLQSQTEECCICEDGSPCLTPMEMAEILRDNPKAIAGFYKVPGKKGWCKKPGRVTDWIRRWEEMDWYSNNEVSELLRRRGQEILDRIKKTYGYYPEEAMALTSAQRWWIVFEHPDPEVRWWFRHHYITEEDQEWFSSTNDKWLMGFGIVNLITVGVIVGVAAVGTGVATGVASGVRAGAGLAGAGIRGLSHLGTWIFTFLATRVPWLSPLGVLAILNNMGFIARAFQRGWRGVLIEILIQILKYLMAMYWEKNPTGPPPLR
jgi:RHS repeat-associated protein